MFDFPRVILFIYRTEVESNLHSLNFARTYDIEFMILQGRGRGKTKTEKDE